MKNITLQWKSFAVDLEKVNSTFKELIGANYDGIIARSEDLTVNFLQDYSTQEEQDLLSFWNSVTETTFEPTSEELTTEMMTRAIEFGNQLILTASVENVMMGITQAGKTNAVADFGEKLFRYLQTGSLYASITEIDSLIANGLPVELEPFITEERLTDYKNRILAYLGS